MASAEYVVNFRARTLCTILSISVSKSSRNFNTTRQLVSRWIFSELNFENFPVRDRSSNKAQNSQFFQHVATSGRHNSAMVVGRRKFITERSLYGMSSSIFTVGVNSSHSSGMYTPYKKPPQIFCDVRRELTAYGT